MFSSHQNGRVLFCLTSVFVRLIDLGGVSNHNLSSYGTICELRFERMEVSAVMDPDKDFETRQCHIITSITSPYFGNTASFTNLLLWRIVAAHLDGIPFGRHLYVISLESPIGFGVYTLALSCTYSFTLPTSGAYRIGLSRSCYE